MADDEARQRQHSLAVVEEALRAALDGTDDARLRAEVLSAAYYAVREN